MIRYLINNPTKWQELELFRFLHTFGSPFDQKVIDFLNSPTNEKEFLKGLTPINRAYYESLDLEFYNDDNELLSECYLLAEKSMLENTSKLINRVNKDLPNKDIFESLEELKTGSEVILQNVVIESKDYFQIWIEELEKKINNEYRIIESEILTADIPLMQSELTIIAARPSMGKTALALSVLLEVAKDNRCLFISSEMPVPRIIDRLVSYESGIATRKISQGRLNDYELSQVVEAVEKVRDNDNLILEYADNMRQIKRIISNTDCNLIAVDYLQLIQAENTKLERRLHVAEISRDFKRIAVQKNVPVMLLAQINRESTKAPDKRPSLTSLAESAAIEQDADNVVFIHRPSYYMTEDIKEQLSEEDLNESELIISKQRDGNRGTKKCEFKGGRFYPLKDIYTSSDDFIDTSDFQPF